MPKRIEPLSNWVSANKAAQLLSDKMGFPIEPKSIRQLAKRKKNPIRTETLGYHQLYNRDDILAVTIKQQHTLSLVNDEQPHELQSPDCAVERMKELLAHELQKLESLPTSPDWVMWSKEQQKAVLADQQARVDRARVTLQGAQKCTEMHTF